MHALSRPQSFVRLTVEFRNQAQNSADAKRASIMPGDRSYVRGLFFQAVARHVASPPREIARNREKYDHTERKPSVIVSGILEAFSLSLSLFARTRVEEAGIEFSSSPLRAREFLRESPRLFRSLRYFYVSRSSTRYPSTTYLFYRC